MAFGTYDTPKIPPPPTFLQYIKTVSKGAEGKTKFAIDIVWMPGKFNNVTLQTHAFRYICDESHPLYGDIKQYFKDLVLGPVSPQLEIVIDSIRERKISVLESTTKKGEWSALGSNAFKFKLN